MEAKTSFAGKSVQVINLEWSDIDKLAMATAREILGRFPPDKVNEYHLYGVPRGGVFAAMAVKEQLSRFLGMYIKLVEDEKDANVFVDDIIDSGKTRDVVIKRNGSPTIPFVALLDKTVKTNNHPSAWYVFPWERMGKPETGPEQNIVRILEYIGEDPNREGLKDTPARVIRSYAELFSGYQHDPKELCAKIFTDGSCDELVLLRNISFTSTCEHHMLPFVGKAHIGYIPDGKVLGISKLSRLLDIYAKRLQIQERLTQQITKALDDHLEPKGSACIIEAHHSCMSCRGVLKPDAIFTTSSLTGVFRNDSLARSELLKLIKG